MFAIIHTCQDISDVFGPFKTVSDAKSWMAQDLADVISAVEKSGLKVKDYWDDGDGNLKLPSCGIKIDSCDTRQTWQIAEFLGR